MNGTLVLFVLSGGLEVVMNMFASGSQKATCKAKKISQSASICDVIIMLLIMCTDVNFVDFHITLYFKKAVPEENVAQHTANRVSFSWLRTLMGTFSDCTRFLSWVT